MSPVKAPQFVAPPREQNASFHTPANSPSVPSASAANGKSDTFTVRAGCVQYLNARPLWHALRSRPDLFSLQYDVPSRVAGWLHGGQVDLALVSTIEYGPRYRVVPGAAVTSNGPVGSVAIFSRKPITRARTLALDASSRTAVALTRILCAEWFDLQPDYVTMRPDLPAMLDRCDAALLIGDAALFVDHVALGLQKYDLCVEWRGLTGLPFVFAFWTGRPDALAPAHLNAIRAARDGGLNDLNKSAAAQYPNRRDLAAAGCAYLHKNIQYRLDDDCIASLNRYYQSAVKLDIIRQAPTLRFYDT